MVTKVRSKALIAIAVLSYLCGVAFAATDPPPPDVDAAAWIRAIYTAVTSKNWGLVVGLALVAVVFPLRKYGPTIFKSKLGGLLLGFVTSLAGTFGAALLAGARPDLAMVITALTTAATAAGLWAWIKDHLPGAQAQADKIAADAPSPVPKPVVTGTTGTLVACFVVVLGLGLQPSCATPVAVAAGPVVIDCLTQNQTQLLELAGDLWAVFGSGGSWADVEASAIASGASLGGCALAEVVQHYLAPPRGRRAPSSDQGRAARAALEDFRRRIAHGATFKTPLGNL